jgi:ElaB/YqjD/DUF883 family membrane-anchored ribosome-binding protein
MDIVKNARDAAESATNGVRDALSDDRAGRARGRMGRAVEQGVEEFADRAADGVERFADRASDVVDSAKRSVDRFDSKAVMSDVESMARRHPGLALVGALAVGFLAGRSLSRKPG